ncbi:MAG: DUF2120 family protein [Methanobacteriaceae archaeon]|nr:DUF2120 family protein [Methanobacteriaceae archaeon]
MELIEISKRIITSLDAFEGSRPVVNSREVIIVRGRSKLKIKAKDIKPKLNEIFKDLNLKKESIESERVEKIVGQIDARLRMTNDIIDTPNVLGIEKLKNSFEVTGSAVEYLIGTKDNIVVFLVMGMDKSGMGPKFVETMISKIDPNQL